jgi:hypothetical protein
MFVRVKATVETPGLDRAEQIFVQSISNALDALGRHLQRGLRGRVRRFSGAEQKNIKYEVRGQGLSKTLTVFGDLIQLWVDEYGLRPGTFAPWNIGSRLFRYVNKLGLVDRPRTERFNAGKVSRPRRTSHVLTRRPGPRRAAGASRGATAARFGSARHRAAPAAARSVAAERRARATRRLAFLLARAIFERGIKASKPIAQTFEANRRKIVADVTNAFVRATNRINRGV